MWKFVWCSLLDAMENVEKQIKIRHSAYANYKQVDAHVTGIKKAELKKRGLFNAMTPETFHEYKLKNQRFKAATQRCTGAEYSLRISRTQARLAINTLLEFVGKEPIPDSMAIKANIVRPGDSNWGKNKDLREIGETSPYVQIFFAPKHLVDPEDESSIARARPHGHIEIAEKGITYLRWYGVRNGTHNFLTVPLRSAKGPNAC